MFISSFTTKEKSIIGFWRIEEQETDLISDCKLSEKDEKLLLLCSATRRRLEILAVRALINKLNLNIEISYSDRKPIASNGFISISHSKNIAAIIWNPIRHVTIDIECVSPRILRIANRVFTKEELDFAKNDIEKLTILWNCKECVFKIANEENIEFRDMIRVFPFNSEKISCEFTRNSNEIKKYEFYFMQLCDNTVVWGND